MSTLKTEVLIIGGGIAGITSALELLNFGKKVCLVDRDKEEKFGGLAKESFGGMFFVDTPQQRRSGIKDNPDLAYKDWLSTAQFDQEDEIPRKWAHLFVNNCTEHIYYWLKQYKIGFFPVVHWVERGLHKPGNSYPRFHMVWGTGFELANVLIRNLRNHPKAHENLKILFDHKVEELVGTGTKIDGVKGMIETTGTPFEIHAEHTIIASGGIGGSIEKVKENWYEPWGIPPEKILNGAHRFGNGALHEEVKKRNGKITHLDRMWPYAAGVHHPRPDKPEHGLSLVPPKSALWLNFRGERIGPIPLVTGYDTRFLVEQICKQEKKYSWQILNLRIAHKEFAISGAEFNDAIREKSYPGFLKSILLGNKSLVKDMIDNCIDFVTANDIEELVVKMNELAGSDDVDIDLLKESISSYDAQIERGPKYFDDEQLRRIAHARQYRGDRVRTCKFQKIYDKKALPLIAIREHILSRKTLGGIQTDLQSRVLDNQGEVLKGLYAIGEASGFGGGGVHGKGALEGTFLGGCILSARIAAYNICGKELA